MRARLPEEPSFLAKNVDLDFFTKEHFEPFCRLQLLPSVVLIVVGAYLVRDTVAPIRASICIMALYTYSYFAHRIVHHFPKPINLHFGHHIPNGLPYGINLFIECIADSLFFFVPWALQKHFNLVIIPPLLIFYYGLIYVSVHIVNYSLVGNEIHEKHHASPMDNASNFGPDTLDHLLNTSHDGSWEDLDHNLPNVVFSYFVSDKLRKFVS
tara:strand:+ start:1152 stop:1784 length:633 start_codon:yes stop_codon:yes gene_type:complete